MALDEAIVIARAVRAQAVRGSGLERGKIITAAMDMLIATAQAAPVKISPIK
jgi:type IV pilus biogenesis protein CpaD/CtpE